MAARAKRLARFVRLVRFVFYKETSYAYHLIRPLISRITRITHHSVRVGLQKEISSKLHASGELKFSSAQPTPNREQNQAMLELCRDAKEENYKLTDAPLASAMPSVGVDLRFRRPLILHRSSLNVNHLTLTLTLLH